MRSPGHQGPPVSIVLPGGGKLRIVKVWEWTNLPGVREALTRLHTRRYSHN